MDTFKIHATLAAVKHKSLSKAAEEFSYTPSAFSHIAAALEEELGVTLLKRSSTGVEWTPEGEQLRPLLEAIVRDEAALKKTAALLSNQKTKELRIGIYSSMSRNFLADILKKTEGGVSGCETVGLRCGRSSRLAGERPGGCDLRGSKDPF